jgi:metallo-beta-lactamase family protein
MSKKRKEEITLTCLGSSASQVTGSSWLCEYSKKDGKIGSIVIECGLNQQGFTELEQYQENQRMLDGIGKEVVRNCEYLLIGHSHIDHVGNLVYFNDDNGFRGEILSTEKCLELTKPLIKNSINIHEAMIKTMRERGIRKRPLYTKSQMYQTFDHMRAVEQGREIVLNEYVTVVFHPNNHVVGANAISLIITKPSGVKKHIIYSSDMGSTILQEFHPYIVPLNIPKKCDMFISEATYSDKARIISKKLAMEERELLKRLIVEGLKKNEDSQILIPTFSFSRTQEFITWLYDNFKDDKFFYDIPIIIDGVLVDEINKVYLRILDEEDRKKFLEVLKWHNIKVNTSLDGTRAVLKTRARRIIISSSGFLTNGRVTNYLPTCLESSKDTIITLGYCGSQDSLGGIIVNTPIGNPINLFNRTIIKNANVYQMKTWSSHISYEELLKLYSELNTGKIIIHHCDEDKKYDFCKEVKEFLMKKNITTPIIPVNRGAFEFKL